MISDTYNTIDAIIKANKKARKDNDYMTLMMNGEALLEYIPELIAYNVDEEHEYRKFEARLLDEKIEGKKPNTSSYCEAQAKATESYKNWQRSKQIIELMYEMVQMAKKLATGVDKEFNNTN